ncbi:hydrolase [Streptomyces violarus]|uniref:Glycerophosphoryl diester phosphodiesterase n=1 Tax=Streptomyces violarus TaxID=67380 RepID=A0A7W4ZVG5_9ACTN|nr:MULTISPECIES: glycerophosphodiester phosphodiesterase family protein [Streptomyces]MBB3079449.1 glycerophosphoryl diester phosphodiesterase [Streptomyces violarus]WRU01990.1 glycerophosphodiester phosphodiesterase family protein [Streptomyces sp. CGMCC 4.1772]GHD26256.1 hydrolase [Streptomyces violarus]
MHARAVAASTTALLGTAALLLPVSPAGAADAEVVPLVIAHRGASAYAPENTLAAVDKAAELGIPWVENDVQQTRDGELVVVHDDNLRRTTDVEEVFPGRAPWKVKDFTAAEIARLDAGSWFGPAYAGARVPTLEQFVDRVERHHQKLLLEIKNPELYPGIERQTLKVLSNEGWLDTSHLAGRLIVQSFSADSVRTVHGLKPGVKTGFLGTPPVSNLSAYADFADQINPSYGSLSTAYVSAVQAFDGPHGTPLEVFTWTVDDAATAQRVARYGVDGIITNKPDVVREAVGG